MTASRLGSVRYDLGLGGELQMVLMAMLGGTYIFGGRGTILGTFLAAWLLVIVSTGMIVANVLPAVQLVVLGVLLIVVDHRHQSHLFPHPEVAGYSAGPNRHHTGGMKCSRNLCSRPGSPWPDPRDRRLRSRSAEDRLYRQEHR